MNGISVYIVYPARILRLRVHGTKKDIMQDTSSEEICVAMAGLIARFDGYEIQLWNVNKYGSCADAVIIGVMPPPLLERQRYYCAVTIGDDVAISVFRLSEDCSRSLVGAILSKLVPATFSTIASFSKMIRRTSPLTCLKDYPRKGEKLTLSPSGTLAAITDSLAVYYF
ncbi:hypothetical protein LOK49_LG09G00451 [Camellia lanceoleosa]|uniref:Uncharacterized protein n=1 Tax=Camellia lanceoleosa TaxID=1840588 RepID=A0ACC0GLD6_9ERIC|nr:hypothetical protein LOK49_LG09G00451 [Camellia lanceoleosa]